MNFQRSLQIWEQALGPEHLNVSDPLNGLANLLRDRNQYAEAERLYQRVLSLREQYLGQQHPDTAQTLHDLAVLRHRQGYLDEALSVPSRFAYNYWERLTHKRLLHGHSPAS